MTALTANRTATRGVLYVHSAPSALCPHIEWAVGGVLGVAVNMAWTPQAAQAGSYRAELSWAGDAGSAAAVASALRGWNHLRFEITEEPTSGAEADWLPIAASAHCFPSEVRWAEGNSAIGLLGNESASRNRTRKSSLSSPRPRSRTSAAAASPTDR